MPEACGPLTWKVKVAFAPGGTLASACAATRFADIQLTPSGAHCASSWLIPSLASCPSTPFVQVCVPVFRKTIVRGELTCPGCSVGYGDWLTQALWNPDSLTTSTETP